MVDPRYVEYIIVGVVVGVLALVCLVLANYQAIKHCLRPKYELALDREDPPTGLMGLCEWCACCTCKCCTPHVKKFCGVFWILVFFTGIALFAGYAFMYAAKEGLLVNMDGPLVALTGGKMTITYSANIPIVYSAFLGLYPERTDATSKSEALAVYPTNGSGTGTVEIDVPLLEGQYELRFINVGLVLFAYGLLATAQCNATISSKAQSNIEHVVILVQENHAFDTYYGRYCTAPPYSNPSCNIGPSCCESAPLTDPKTNTPPTRLTDEETEAFDPCHFAVCEHQFINGGRMDSFVEGAFVGFTEGANPRNFAFIDNTTGNYQTLWKWAQDYAIADRYFQPMVGGSSGNTIYFAHAGYVFTDNLCFPEDAVGAACQKDPRISVLCKSFRKPALGHLLDFCGVSFTQYSEGYDAMKAANANGQKCGEKVGVCQGSHHPPDDPCQYNPSDASNNYYAGLRDDPAHMKDTSDFEAQLAAGTLPQYVFIRELEANSDHPGYAFTRTAERPEIGITAGTNTVKRHIDMILNSSKYQNNTLILVTWDESGGYYDHIPPPPASIFETKDGAGVQYGARVPLIALGYFAKKNYISHQMMEHTSVVKFIQWNFLGASGQLHRRDADPAIQHISDLLDLTKAGRLP